MGQSCGGIFSIDVPSSQMTLTLCQLGEKKKKRKEKKQNSKPNQRTYFSLLSKGSIETVLLHPSYRDSICVKSQEGSSSAVMRSRKNGLFRGSEIAHPFRALTALVKDMGSFPNTGWFTAACNSCSKGNPTPSYGL